MIETKVCCTCKIEKNLIEFAARSGRTGSVRSYCKQCGNEHSRRHRATDPEYRAKERERLASPQRKQYMLQYYEANKQRLNESSTQRNRRIIAERPKIVPTSCSVYFLVCEVTGKLFTSKVKAAKYSAEGRLLAKRQYAEALKAKEKTKIRVCTCRVCGSAFTAKYGDKSRSFCSVECKRRQNCLNSKPTKNYRRRARHYGVAYQPISAVEVFDRDKWTCKLCGTKTPKRLRGTIVDNAPELDHITPISKGGGHVASNLQCLCRNCNGKKSDKLLGQLTLNI
jgi:5-methylcytosine-specific restriction endonuclease McrA